MSGRTRRSVLLGLLPIAAALACGEAPAPPPEPDASTQRRLAQGAVVGFTSEDGAHVWRGLPFAAPPVGPLRWRAPRPPEPWSGERDATRFGPPCVQYTGPLGGGDATQATGSEDCLVLNVFAPPFEPDRVPQGADRLPVMVWIHGGGNTIGSAEVYEASRLAIRAGVIVVAVHYRLGVFGWFRHPSLYGEGDSADDRSGNYGTLDLVRALEWVRENAPAFGGDPGRVTVFGESAGGVNVYSLLLSPRAIGLFQGAIVQSGGLWTRTLAEMENFTDDPEPGHPGSSREALLRLLETRGAADRAAARRELEALSADETGQLLRGAPAEEILRLFDGSRLGGMYDAPTLARDGHVLPAAEPMDVLRAGEYNRVPVIAGTNRDENKLFLLFGSDAVRHLLGVPLWLRDARLYGLQAEYASRMWKATGVDAPVAAMRRAQGPSVFAYRFDWDEEPSVLWADFGEMLGAAHAVEIPFVFGRLDLGPANRFVFDEVRLPAAERLSDAMTSYWGAFAHGGHPGRGAAGALPEWRPWSEAGPGAPKFLVLDTDDGGGIRMASKAESAAALIAAVAADDRFASRAERCAVYAGYVQWSGALDEDEYDEVDGGACRAFPLEDARR